MHVLINSHVLMSGADHFNNAAAINPFYQNVPVNREKAQSEHDLIHKALTKAGVTVTTVPPPHDSQDGVYTANWALVRGEKAVLSTLPNVRKKEESYAETVLKKLGKKVTCIPNGTYFSGQGDALPCGDFLFVGTGYRTEKPAHDFIADALGYTIIGLKTIPKRQWWGHGKPAINKITGLPDSFFYDIDLALAVIRGPQKNKKGLIAWCPAAFTPESRRRLHAFNGVDKIEVSFSEAKRAFACNLVSTGETVVMSARAPKLQTELEARGFNVITPEITELAKGGGYIRCTTLTLNNI